MTTISILRPTRLNCALLRGVLTIAVVGGGVAAALAAAATTFSSTGAIEVFDGSGAAPPTSPEARTPYPSTIEVTGLTGAVTDINVKLTGVAHPRPDDLDVMLVGPSPPSGRVVLLSDAGENTAFSGDLTYTTRPPARLWTRPA